MEPTAPTTPPAADLSARVDALVRRIRAMPEDEDTWRDDLPYDDDEDDDR